MNDTTPAHILIVDDNELVLETLVRILASENYAISRAQNGIEALAQISKNPPDVILLDLMMPEMDGFETCRRVKSEPCWRHIPIILVTALDDRESIIKGLNAGADEFLPKPVGSAELRARVRSMLRIKQNFDALQVALNLQEEMAHMIVHDMRNPLTSILMSSEALLSSDQTQAMCAKVIQNVYHQARRVDNLVGDLLVMAKMKSGRIELDKKMVPITTLVCQAFHNQEEIARLKRIDLVTEIEVKDPVLNLDNDLILRVLDNLLFNAIKFSPSGSQVILKIGQAAVDSAGEGKLFIQIIDQGPGIPAEYRERVFEEYEIVRAHNNGLPQVGLGLSFCKKVIDAHEGTLCVEDNTPQGSIFTIGLSTGANGAE